MQLPGGCTITRRSDRRSSRQPWLSPPASWGGSGAATAGSELLQVPGGDPEELAGTHAGIGRQPNDDLVPLRPGHLLQAVDLLP